MMGRCRPWFMYTSTLRFRHVPYTCVWPLLQEVVQSLEELKQPKALEGLSKEGQERLRLHAQALKLQEGAGDEAWQS